MADAPTTDALARARRLLNEVARFGVVGIVGFVIDVGAFNLLAYGAGVTPTLAKCLSVAIATVATWLGNRHFVFGDRRGRSMGREAALFVAFSLAGMVIAVGTLWVSHNLLGLTSPLADNISANVIGFGLAAVFRFVTYRAFVFRPEPVPVPTGQPS